MKTARRDCQWCGTRLLVVRGVPALNYGEDPAGRVAVSIDDPKRGRFLAKAEAPGPLEHRHSVHECDGQKRAAQRGDWTAAIGDLHKARRRLRGRPRRTQQAATLPGMNRIYPGRTP